MKTLTFNAYKDKVRACFLGKNIGGSLGTPFEGARGVFNVTGYTHDTSKGAMANDDLDLQLVFLRAAEAYGTGVNSHILGEYWLNQIIAHWSEYGMGKANMRMGLLPPVSGSYRNPMGNSNGCFIRSEIWACLAPGHPEVAVKYAMEDAMVDHFDEGLYGEIFTAALESAAFIESDMEKLVEIAASYIPENSAVLGAVRLAKKCYDDGKTWREARSTILNAYPDSFCFKTAGENNPEDCAPLGPIGYDAPANIGLAMLGWYYGEGDFGKSLCITASCGEDADCTCATLGSIFGIIGGTASIPNEWIEPIGEDIKTISLDLTDRGSEICKTITELTDRIVNLMPTFMRKHINFFGENGAVINAYENKLICQNDPIHFGYPVIHSFRDDVTARQPLTLTEDNPVFDALLDFCGTIEISEGEEKALEIKLHNKIARQFYVDVTVYAPEGWEVLPTRTSKMLLGLLRDGYYSTQKIKLVPHGLDKGVYRFPIEVHISDRPTSVFFPVTLIVK